jgi:hypothetical protein
MMQLIAGIAYHDLVEEVLDKLLLQWSRGEESVQVGAEELGHEVAGPLSELFARIAQVDQDVHVLERRNENVAERNDLLFVSHMATIRISSGISLHFRV